MNVKLFLCLITLFFMKTWLPGGNELRNNYLAGSDPCVVCVVTIVWTISMNFRVASRTSDSVSVGKEHVLKSMYWGC